MAFITPKTKLVRNNKRVLPKYWFLNTPSKIFDTIGNTEVDLNLLSLLAEISIILAIFKRPNTLT